MFYLIILYETFYSSIYFIISSKISNHQIKIILLLFEYLEVPDIIKIKINNIHQVFKQEYYINKREISPITYSKLINSIIDLQQIGLGKSNSDNIIALFAIISKIDYLVKGKK